MLPLLCLAVSLSLQQPGATSAALHAHPRRLLLRVSEQHARTRIVERHPQLQMRELWNLPQIGWRAVEVSDEVASHALHLARARAVLAADPAVSEVRADHARVVQGVVPDDPLLGNQWHLDAIQAPLAWQTETGDPSVVVAVIDTGIELTHPDLASNLWTNPGEIPGNFLDDDGNGWIDDVHGYDFANMDADPSDDHSHGTACAGIVAAVQDNSIGGSGVAPGCRVAAVKAGLSTGYFYASAVVPALVYCADMGFEVASLSFFSDEVVPAERDAIAYCWSKGVLPVVSAGNANSVLPYYPAGYAETLAVGATIDATDARAFFSNWGTWVDVAAPGWALTTTTLGGGYTGGFNGTSGAAPHVAGVAALLFSAMPGASNADVRAAIEDGATLLDEPPRGKWTRYGRVDAAAALARVLGNVTGPVPARLAFVAPCGGLGQRSALRGLGQGPHTPPPGLTVHGVGLEEPGALEVRSGGGALRLLAQERGTARAYRPVRPAPSFELRRNDAQVASWIWEPGPGLLFAATDAGTSDGGALATGGWAELYREDGSWFTCSANATGLLRAELVVRAVDLPSPRHVTLELARAYDALLPGAVETVELYDWASGSLPYGSWITLSSGPAPGPATSLLTVDVPGDAAAARDGENAYYLRVTVTGAGALGALRADMLRLRVQ